MFAVLVLPVLAKADSYPTELGTFVVQNSDCSTLFESGNLKNALSHCITEAKNGSVTASEILSKIYAVKGALLDYSKALKWAKIASEKGSVNSQAMLGLMYLRGEGTEKDVKKAQHYIQLAIDNGHKGALQLRKLMKRAGLWQKST